MGAVRMDHSTTDKPLRIQAGLLTLAAVTGAVFHMVFAGVAAPKAKPADIKAPKYLSPTAMVADSAGGTIYIAQKTAGSVALFDVKTLKVAATINIGLPVSGVALSCDETQLYVTAGGAKGLLCMVDIKSKKVLAQIPVGHTPMSPVVSRNGDTIYICNQFDNTIAVVDVVDRRLTNTIPAGRQPVSIDLSKDDSVLLAANHLPAGRASVDYVAATVTVIPTAAGQDASIIKLPNGSTNLRSIRISPDGSYAIVTHNLARFHMPATQLERGRVNTNAITLIDVAKRTWVNTFLLDDVDRGAANPWAIAWSDDSRTLCISHAGNHEISVIDFRDMLAKIGKAAAEKKLDQIQNDLSFLASCRYRLELPGEGPRSMVIIGANAYVGEYFTDSIAIADLTPQAKPKSKSIPLGPRWNMTRARRGEMLFNSAELCFQKWHCCATCHPGGRNNGLNWDLMHDGLGNPKNVKSLLLSPKTPPSMITGVRPNAKIAIMSKIRFVQFAVRPAGDANDIHEYLKSITPAPGPRLVNGKLSPAALRGAKLFKTAKCASCHSGALLTDLKKHNVGTAISEAGKQGKEYDTPTLIEVWRTAPYLSSGQAATILDVLSKKHNPKDLHGKTSDLTKQQLADLAEYVMSL